MTTRPGTSYRFRVRAKDKAGNRSDWIDGGRFTAQLVQSDSALVGGNWRQDSSDKGSLSGSLSSTQPPGTTARVAFHASSIGVVASRGPKFGAIRVLVDGRAIKTVDLWARKEKNCRVVFVQSWQTDGNHAITVQALDTNGRSKVDLDAFVLLH